MTKVQMAPGIPNEKSRTVRPVHGPATIHLPSQGYALPLREGVLCLLHALRGTLAVEIQCHPGVRRDPEPGAAWIPACAGMTPMLQAPSVDTPEYITRSRRVIQHGFTLL